LGKYFGFFFAKFGMTFSARLIIEHLSRLINASSVLLTVSYESVTLAMTKVKKMIAENTIAITQMNQKRTLSSGDILYPYSVSSCRKTPILICPIDSLMQ
jgi:hypothetical protein